MWKDIVARIDRALDETLRPHAVERQDLKRLLADAEALLELIPALEHYSSRGDCCDCDECAVETADDALSGLSKHLRKVKT